MRIAGILQTKNYDPRCKAFQQLRELTDCVIVLDDNSTTPFPFADQCDVFLSQKSKHGWNCTANLTTLLYHAFVHDCKTVLHLDDDMILGTAFRENVRSLAASDFKDSLWIRRFDFWESFNSIRVDGFWNNRTFPVLIRNWFFDERPRIVRPTGRYKFHTDTHAAPQKRYDLNTVVYHAGNMTLPDRKARVETLTANDPQKIWRSNYDFILSERGLVTAPLPKTDLQLVQNLIGSAPL